MPRTCDASENNPWAEPISPDVIETAVLSLFLHRHPAPVHKDELARAFAEDDWEAAIAGLVGDGVIHRQGALYIASRPVVRGAELLGW